MSDTDLRNMRVEAAERSGGTSAEPIYSLFERTIRQENLKGEVLDFGAGTGGFTQRLFEMGVFERVAGVDIMARPADLGAEIDWRQADLNENTTIESGSFDGVVSPEVIEHLENPWKLAREWMRILRPGGWLLMSTPNNESWRALLALVMRGHFVAFGHSSYPAHITAPVRIDLERVLTRAGFENVTFRYSDRGVVPRFNALTWQGVSGGLLKGRRYSETILAFARKPK